MPPWCRKPTASRHFVHQFRFLLERQRRDSLRQRRAFQELHDEVRRLAGGAQVVNAHDIGMRQARHGAGLSHEAGVQRGVVRVTRGQRLDGNLAAQGFVDREQHAAHPAGADLGDDLVAGEPLRERRGVQRAIDLSQRRQLARQFGSVVAARPAIQNLRERLGQAQLVLVVHHASPRSHKPRKRFTAR
jgi:hypothetical protein